MAGCKMEHASNPRFGWDMANWYVGNETEMYDKEFASLCDRDSTVVSGYKTSHTDHTKMSICFPVCVWSAQLLGKNSKATFSYYVGIILVSLAVLFATWHSP